MANGFSLTYIVATLTGLLSAYLMHRASPDLNPIIKFFVLPFLVIYVMFMILKFIFPNLGRFGRELKGYVEYKTAQDINDSGYVEIFPPLFAVFLVIVIVLYSGMFGK